MCLAALAAAGPAARAQDPSDGTYVPSFAELEAGLKQRVFRRTSVWSSNAEEATALTGVDDPAQSVAEAATRLPPGSVCIVRDGPQGCWVLDTAGGTAPTHLPGYPQEPVDTNGAGDAHTGVLCAERALGTAWLEAARRANAAGAIKVTRRGPATGC